MTHANPPSTPIATSKSAALSRVLDLVGKGYTRHIAGQVPVKKAKALAQKFHDHYGIGCSPSQRLTRKKHGQANAALVMYWPAVPEAALASPIAVNSSLCPTTALSSRLTSDQPAVLSPDELTDGSPIEPAQLSSDPQAEWDPPDARKVTWLLLVSPGEGAVVDNEKLASVLATPRLVWLGYELVRLPKRGDTRWTWRRTKQEMADWYALLASQLTQPKAGAVEQTLLRVSRQPGFSGVRQQSWQLMQFARSRGYAGELPFLFHLQKIGHGHRLQLE